MRFPFALFALACAASAQDVDGRFGTYRFRHVDGASGVAFSPDGQWIASVGADRLVRIRDIATGAHVRTLRGSHSPLLGVAFSRDGKRLAAVGESGELRLWDPGNGRKHGSQGRWIDLGEDEAEGNALAFSPTADQFAVEALDHKVLLCRGKDRKLEGALKGMEKRVYALAYSPDGESLAAAGAGGEVRLWNLKTRDREWSREIGSRAVLALSWSPDGSLLAVGSSGGDLRLRDGRTGAAVRRLDGHGVAVSSAAFFPDGKRLVSAGRDRRVRIWDVATGAKLLEIRLPAEVSAIAVSPDGNLLATSDLGGAVRLWEASTGKERDHAPGHRGAISDLALDGSGALLVTASADRTVRFWDTRTRTEVGALRIPGAECGRVAMSRDGRVVVCSSNDGVVRVFDRVAGRRLHRIRRPSVWGAMGGPVAIAPDGSRYALGRDDGALEIRDAVSGALDRTIEAVKKDRPCNGLFWSADGLRIVAARWEQPVVVYDAATGREVAALDTVGHLCIDLSLSAAGETLATVGADGALTVFDVDSNRKRAWSASRNFRSVALSEDGLLVAAGSSWNTVEVFDAMSGKPVRESFKLRGFVECLAFTPDGRSLIAAGRDAVPLARRLPEDDDPALGLADLWTALAGSRSGHLASWRLAARPGAAAFLKDRLAIRLPAPDEAFLADLAALSDSEVAAREAASRRLSARNVEYLPLLQDAFADAKDPEAQGRLSLILESWEATDRPAARQRARAIGALRRAGTQEAAEVLQCLAKESPLARERRQAGGR
jgi:WD40 repeat protein